MERKGDNFDMFPPNKDTNNSLENEQYPKKFYDITFKINYKTDFG
mgnify:CR=1 FL=1